MLSVSPTLLLSVFFRVKYSSLDLSWPGATLWDFRLSNIWFLHRTLPFNWFFLFVVCFESTGLLLGIAQSSCSHVCLQLCMGLGQTELRPCLLSPVALVPCLQDVLLRTLQLSLCQHRPCSHSSVGCLFHALFVRHLHHSAQEAWCVFFVQRATLLDSHQSLDEVGFSRLQGKRSALSSSSSFQHVQFGAFLALTCFDAPLLHLPGAISL